VITSLRRNYRYLKAFFAQLKPEEYDKQYGNLMEQQFLLKRYGKLTLFEQAAMSSEDRQWWLKRIQEENEKQAESEKKASSGASRPNMPSMPSMPSMPRR
jgi:hypothetical protein